MLPKSSFPCEDPRTGVELGSPCRGIWGQILDKEEQLEHVNFMAGYKESLDSLRLFNHPHIKPGLHYRAAKATDQPLWLRSCHFWLCGSQQLPKPFLTSPNPNRSLPCFKTFSDSLVSSSHPEPHSWAFKFPPPSGLIFLCLTPGLHVRPWDPLHPAECAVFDPSPSCVPS